MKMFLEQETRRMVIKITKEEIDDVEIVKKYKEYMKSVYDIVEEPLINTSYSISYNEDEDLALLYIHTFSEQSIFTQTIPVDLLINLLCKAKSIEFEVISIISDKEKNKIDNLVNGNTNVIEDDDDDSEEKCWYLELEFDEKNYIQFIESDVQLN